MKGLVVGMNAENEWKKRKMLEMKGELACVCDSLLNSEMHPYSPVFEGVMYPIVKVGTKTFYLIVHPIFFSSAQRYSQIH